MPGRFVTYIRLNPRKMYEYGVTKEEIFDLVNQKWGSQTKVFMEYNMDLLKDVINIFNDDKCTDEDVKKLTFIDKNGFEVPIMAIAEVTTWKEEAIKDIGGEDAFNQEYGLRFINASKSLLNEAIIDELLKNKKNYVYESISEFDKKLKFSYTDLKWVEDDNVFIPLMRKDYKIVISVDISEGLGQDYSIINIFRVSEKPKDLTELQKHFIIEKLVLKNVPVNIFSSKNDQNPLHLACMKKYMNIIKYLVEKGCNKDKLDNEYFI